MNNQKDSRILEDIFTCTAVPIAYLDSAFNYIRVNQAYAAANGGELETYIGRNHFELYPDDENLSHFRKTMESGEPCTILTKGAAFAPHPDGVVDHWDMVLNPVKEDADGPVTGLVLSLLPASERVENQAALRREWSFLDSLADAVEAIVLVLDENGRIVRFNSYMEKLSGYTLTEVRGKDWFSTFLPSGDQGTIRSVYRETLAGVPTSGTVNPILTKDGRERRIEWYNTRLADSGGRTAGAFIVGQDVTDRHISQRKLSLWSHVFEHANWGMVLCNACSTRLDRINPTFARERGYTVDELEGREIALLFPPDRLAEAMEQVERAERLGHTCFESVHLRKDGSRFPVWIEVTVAFDEQDKPLYRATVVQDLTERKKTEEALQQSEAAFRAIVETSRDWIWAIDLDGKLTYSNPALEEILGYAPAEVVGKQSLDLIHEDDRESEMAMLEDGISNREGWSNLTIRWRHKDGGFRYLESSAVPRFDASDRLVGFRGVDRDITERKEFQEELEYLATHDLLTGLYNRKVLEQRLQEELLRAARYGQALSLFMLDIDHFKPVNDTYGHQTGDAVLSSFAKLLESSVRQTDIVARYGGEEFIVMLPQTALVEARELAQRLHDQIGGHAFSIKGDKEIRLSASIGISCYPEHGATWEELLDTADAAMYNAKVAGRNQIKTT